MNANNIASWNGTAFSLLGPGITGGTPSVNTLTVYLNILMAGGVFTNAGLGAVPAANIAAWGSLPAAPTLISPANMSTNVSVTPTLNWSDVTNSTSYGVQVSTNPNFTTTVINQSGLVISQYSVAAPLNNSTLYFWRANAANGLGNGPFSLVFFFTTGFVGIINNQEIPAKFNLYQNYPNPFNPVTKIRFDLPLNNVPGAMLKLTVYDISGRIVSELLNTQYAAGKWEVDFDGTNYSSCVYFYKIEAGNYSSVNKMTLVK